MTSAAEFSALSDTLFHWSVYEPSVKCEVGCTAFRQPSGLVIVDPVPLAEPAMAELLALAPLRAILLTNGNHVRHADALRHQHQVPIATAPVTRKEISELKPDVVLLEHELLYGIAAIPIPGATLGETAFFAKDTGVIVLGDAVINVNSEKGLELLPDKYCADPEQNRASLEKLLSFDFHTITFAHGTPVTARAKEKLRALLTR
jgi:glyoxylase-like metal-dependent hydrolase (beta-lactamase superfamily II)